MSENVVRVGLVSSINYKTGMVKVTYPGYDHSVTDALPFFAPGDEYKMPGVGEEVLVLHLSNGAEAGIVMGRYWNVDNRPQAYGKGVYRKELGAAPGEAFVECRDGVVRLHDREAEATLGGILERLRALEERLNEDKGDGGAD